MARLVPSRALLAGAVVALIAGSALVGFASAGGAAVQPAFRQPVGLNHFLCYGATTDAATGPGFAVPPGVVAINSETTAAGFMPFAGPVPTTLERHCNPAVKTVVIVKSGKVKATFPILNPGWHLSCFKVTNPVAPTIPTVTVQNQFGKASLTLSLPGGLCAPTMKSLQPPPAPFQPTSGITPDHLTCYPVTYATLTTKPFKVPVADTIRVQDEFSPSPQTIQVLAPEALCIPTEKVLPGGKVFPVANPAANLLCFGLTPATPVITPIWDGNQFGVAQVTITVPQSDERLCLPSTVKYPKTP